MKRLLLTTIALLAPVAVVAEPSSPPSSQVAWTPETLNFVKNGDLSKGKVLAESCKSCHGQAGEGMTAQTVDDETIPAVPALAGQLANYSYKQLRDYFDGKRGNASMTGIAKGLSEQNAADLAVWYASLPTPKAGAAGQAVAKAEKLAEQGDDKRILPACFVCHGGNGEGEKMDIPALAGQQADYLVATLQAYKSGERHNDIYSRMRLIAQQLNEEEIKELAQYYQQLK